MENVPVLDVILPVHGQLSAGLTAASVTVTLIAAVRTAGIMEGAARFCKDEETASGLELNMHAFRGFSLHHHAFIRRFSP